MTDAAATTTDTTQQSAAALPNSGPPLPVADTIIAAIKNDFLDAVNALTAERDALKAQVTELEAKGTTDLDAAGAAYAQQLTAFKDEVQKFVTAAVAERDTLAAKVTDLEAKLVAAGGAVVGAVETAAVDVYKDAEEEAAALKAKITAGLADLRTHAGRLADITPQAVRTGAVGLARALSGVGTYIASHL